MSADTITFDDKVFQRILDDLRIALIADGRESDAAKLVEDEFRIVMRDIIRKTPPPNKQAGEATINQDLHQVFQVVDDDFARYVASNFGTENVRHWLMGKSGEVDYFVEWQKLVPEPDNATLKAFHEKYRRPNGRVYQAHGRYNTLGIWTEKMVVSKSAFESYRKVANSLVGLMRSGWGKAFVGVGGKVPIWVSRLIGKYDNGEFQNGLSDARNPNVVVINRSPGIERQTTLVRWALDKAKENMRRRIRLIVSGYAKDIAEGIRPRKQVKPTPGSGNAD